MESEDVLKKLESILIDSLSKSEEWILMVNDLEMYHKIQSLIIESFECTLSIMPPQIKAKVETIMGKLRNVSYIFEYDDLVNFLTFAQILSTSLLSDLDDKEIHDYAAPHKIVGVLDTAIRLNKKEYSEENLPEMGAFLNLGLFKLKAAIENTDWKKGWKDF